MRGHENIIAMRMKGVKPAGLVYLCDYPVRPEFIEWQYASDCMSPNVSVYGDEIGALDMRFVVGLAVDVSGNDAKRVKALAGACKRAGASMVIANDGQRYAMWKTGEAAWLSF